MATEPDVQNQEPCGFFRCSNCGETDFAFDEDEAKRLEGQEHYNIIKVSSTASRTMGRFDFCGHFVRMQWSDFNKKTNGKK